MKKIASFFSILTILILQLEAQNVSPRHFVFINYATDLGFWGYNGRLYKIRDDSILVMNRIGWNKINDTNYVDIYDTTLYFLTKRENHLIIKMINTIDSLPFCSNSCIMDGLRFYFTCSIDTVRHGAWVSNAYNEKIFFFVDIINKHVPNEFKIRYNKKTLIKDQEDCLRSRKFRR